jgi:mannosyltransferase
MTRSSAAWIALGGVTLLALMLRLVFVGDQSLGYEEIYTLTIVQHTSVAGVWRAVDATESTPPLYYVLTWLWTQLTSSATATALRMISVLAGTASVPVAYLAVRSLVSVRVALVVAWLCAVSPELVGYSIYARSYALLVLMSTLSIWALGVALADPTRRRLALWALAAAAAIWTHYFAAFVILAEAGVLVARLPRRREGLAAAGGIVLLTVPLWPLVLSQSGSADRTAYIAATPLVTRLEYTVRELAMGSNVPTAWLEGAGIVLVVLAAAVGILTTRRQQSTRILSTICVVGGGLPILAAATGIYDVFRPRNILGIWVALAALAALGLVRLRAAALVLYSVMCLVTVVWVQSDWPYQGAVDWQGASERVASQVQGAPVAVMPGLEQPVGGVYLHRLALTRAVVTRNLWVFIEPARGPGERALEPVPNPPLAALWGPRFHVVAEIDYRGFRIIHLRATSPTPVPPVPSHDGPPGAPLALLLAAPGAQ